MCSRLSLGPYLFEQSSAISWTTSVNLSGQLGFVSFGIFVAFSQRCQCWPFCLQSSDEWCLSCFSITLFAVQYDLLMAHKIRYIPPNTFTFNKQQQLNVLLFFPIYTFQWFVLPVHCTAQLQQVFGNALSLASLLPSSSRPFFRTHPRFFSLFFYGKKFPSFSINSLFIQSAH